MIDLICNICNKGRSLKRLMNEKLKKAQELVKKYNQEHLLKFYDEMSDEKKEALLDQILSIDFDLMNQLYDKVIVPPDLKMWK